MSFWGKKRCSTLVSAGANSFRWLGRSCGGTDRNKRRQTISESRGELVRSLGFGEGVNDRLVVRRQNARVYVFLIRLLDERDGDALGAGFVEREFIEYVSKPGLELKGQGVPSKAISGGHRIVVKRSVPCHCFASVENPIGLPMATRIGFQAEFGLNDRPAQYARPHAETMVVAEAAFLNAGFHQRGVPNVGTQFAARALFDVGLKRAEPSVSPRQLLPKSNEHVGVVVLFTDAHDELLRLCRSRHLSFTDDHQLNRGLGQCRPMLRSEISAHHLENLSAEVSTTPSQQPEATSNTPIPAPRMVAAEMMVASVIARAPAW